MALAIANPKPSSSTPTGATSGTKSGHTAAQKPFDFTKRRRWADVLLSALPGAALLVLDKRGAIEYSGPGTKAVLGWDVDEVVEKNVLEFVNGAFFSRVCCDE